MKSIPKCWWSALVLAAFVGCDSPAPTPVAPAKPAEAKKTEEKKVDVKDAKLSDKELAAIKLLPEAEQKLALEQKLCPVGDSHLGAMGKPFKVMLKGQTVFLCCDGCEDEAKEKADAILAKLAKK